MCFIVAFCKTPPDDVDQYLRFQVLGSGTKGLYSINVVGD